MEKTREWIGAPVRLERGDVVIDEEGRRGTVRDRWTKRGVPVCTVVDATGKGVSVPADELHLLLHHLP